MKGKIININGFVFFIITVFISIIGNDKILSSQLLSSIRYGEWMIDNHSILSKDIFSYTMANSEWINNNWLYQIIVAEFFRYFGLRGIVILASLIIGSIFCLFIDEIFERQKNIIMTTIIFCFALYTSLMQWVVSPMILTVLFSLIFYVVLSRFIKNEAKKIYIFALPFIYVIWVNTSEEFLLGIFIFVVFLLGIALNSILTGVKYEKSLIVKLVSVFILVVLSGFVSPFGIKNYQQFIINFGNRYAEKTTGWDSPDFHGYTSIGALYLIFTFVLILVQKNSNVNKKIGYEKIILLLLSQSMFLYSQKYIMVFILFSALIVAEFFSLNEIIGKIRLKKFFYGKFDRIDEISKKLYERGQHKYAWVMISVTMVFFIVLNSEIERRYPTSVLESVMSPIEYLKNKKISGNGFHTDMYGNLIIWEKVQNLKVFIDNRLGLDEQVFVDYGNILFLIKDWRKKIDSYNFQWIIIIKGFPLYVVLEEDKNWVQVYSDGIQIIYLKKDYYEKLKADKIVE